MWCIKRVYCEQLVGFFLFFLANPVIQKLKKNYFTGSLVFFL